MMANKAFALDKPAAQLPLIDFTSEDAPDAFFDSLKTFGFATLMSHPLDMARVGRIYSEWRAQFSQGVPSGFAMIRLIKTAISRSTTPRVQKVNWFATSKSIFSFTAGDGARVI